MATINPLISTQKPSDTSLDIALHPLVLLTISDYITRHTLRQQKGPIVGALLGQQNGREITIEHAFDCLLVEKDVKDVHKVPALEFVGWYTILPVSGPQPNHLPMHLQILQSYNESAILLGFHPTAVLEDQTGGKLPITIYESNYEAEDAPEPSGEDKEMKDGDSHLALKFRELSYSVETGEAEMISVDFVARGGGNATAVGGTESKPAKDDTEVSKGKGKSTRASKKKEDETEATKVEDQHILTREDEELIASLTAKANAIKMLHSRINLIAIYLQNLPPSYISGELPESVEPLDQEYAPVNHAVLRSIQALLSRLTLLIPADSQAFQRELISERNDVNLVSLLSTITNSIKDVRETGRKYGIIENARAMKSKSERGAGGQRGWGGPFDGVMGVGDLLS